MLDEVHGAISADIPFHVWLAGAVLSLNLTVFPSEMLRAMNTSFRNPPVFMKSSTQHSTEAAVFIGAASSVEVLACRNSSMSVPRNGQITLASILNDLLLSDPFCTWWEYCSS